MTAKKDVGYSELPSSLGQGKKLDSGKPRMDLLVPEADIEVARVLGFGASKYDENNWKKGISYSRLHGAVRRHLAAWSMGEDLDPESGLPHLAHARCGLDFLIWMSKHRPELDDRYIGRDGDE